MGLTQLSALRAEMKKRQIDIYLIPTSDFHESEYVGDYFKARKFISGFSGSAGTAVVTGDRAGVWTDGRYFIQAEAELKDSGFTLYRMGQEGVPTIEEFLREHLPQGGVLGFDGRVVNCSQAQKYQKLAEQKGGSLYVKEDLVDLIWTDRPQLPGEEVWILNDAYSGESLTSKLERIRAAMAEQGADHHLVSSLYDIAWIMNLRGNDIKHVPVFLSFLLIGPQETTLFIQDRALTPSVRVYLEEHQIRVCDYDQIYASLENLPAGAKILMDPKIINYRLRMTLSGEITVIEGDNPSEAMKAVKNETELANTRMAHLKDGLAMTRFMHWLKTNVGKTVMTEYSVGEHLNGLRKQQEHFLDLSFDNICAYGANAAMMHYSAKKDDCAQLKPEGMLLVDSGGHYLEGTTDITRTFILGPVTDEMKLHFTTVAKANLALANAKFLYGCRGINLDILCRGPLWQMGIDYQCGTGHGVGHILNVHEGPNGFRWKIVPERKDSGCLEAGMITTDEPGVYLEGKYGIRTENELICVKAEKNEYGQFLKFENITYCPIDLDGIDAEELSRSEKKQLNDYHKMVYEKLAPLMTEEERIWLKEYTRAI